MKSAHLSIQKHLPQPYSEVSAVGAWAEVGAPSAWCE